ATTLHLRGQRAMDCLEDPLDLGVVEVRQGRVRAHPAGVRSEASVAEALVIARRRKRDRLPAVADRDDARLVAFEPFLDDEGWPAGRPTCEEARGELEGLGQRIRDDDALAGGEAVGLEDRARSVRIELSE